MQIRRIEISAFRCFRDSIVIDDIGDEVTLLVGDNEDGKSTVLAALQTVLFEKHNIGGAVAAAMLPYGSKVRPEIKLEFDHDGVHYRLSKAFCQRPEAELEADGGARWSGDAAEEQLREMLEFTPPSRGGSKPEHRGLQALFWVEQGSAFTQPQVNETVQNSLSGALETEVGTVTGGERGRTLIRRVESRVNEILTPRNKNPTGAYKDAINRSAEARTRRDELALRLKEFEDKVDALTRERQRLAKLESDDPIDAAEKRLLEAKDAVRNVEGLENSLQTTEANLKTTQSEHTLAESRLDRRQESRKKVEEADKMLADMKGEEVSAREAVNGAQATLINAEGLHAKAKKALEATRKKAMTARRLADLLRKSEELAATRERLKKAATADEIATDLRAKAKASAFTSTVIEALRRLDSNVREEAIRLEAVATLLELTPDEGRLATIQGKATEVDALTIIEPTQIELEGYGTIRVTPGGEDLSSRRKAAEAAASELTFELEKYCIASVQDAVRQADDRGNWLNDAAIHHTTVEAHAPEGLDALRSDVATLEAEVAMLEAEVAQIPEDIEDAEVPNTTAEKAASYADELARKLKDVEPEERHASDDLKDAEGDIKTKKDILSSVTSRREREEIRVKDLRDVLDGSVTEVKDDELEQALDDATEAQLATSAAVAKVKTALAESDPDGVRRELEVANVARNKVGANLAERRQMVRDLEIELRTLGKDDTAAEIEVAEGELARAKILKARLAHEADALVLLQDTLAEHEQIARETFLAPIRDHIEPYLKRLFPGSELMLDDQTLKITHLRRENQDEPYDRLSIGTREQLAVLARLAFADLLDKHGKKSPIILDDALVFSDDRRIKEMLGILDRAAERLQIIVLTCHERVYFDRGWTTRRLEHFKKKV